MPATDGQNSVQKWRASRGWLPWTLHKVYLLPLAGLFLFMLGVIELLREYSKRMGGIVHWAYEEDLPTATWGAYTYLPLIFALLAINLLDVCAQDVLRLEPYFQLAKPGGAPATVLFNNYCCNAFTASIIAFRNRHWVVLCVAPVSLIFRMFLPSLLAGLVILDDGSWVERKIVNTWPTIIDLEIQQLWLAAGSSGEGPMGSPELNSFFMPDPADYATPPTSLPDDQNESSLLTLNQTIYWSNMTCVSNTRRGLSPQTETNLTLTSQLPHGQQIWSWNVGNMSMGNLPGGNSSSRCQISTALDTVIGSDQQTLQAKFWEPMGYDGKLLAPSAFTYEDCSAFKVFGVIVDMQLAAGNVSDSNVTVLACSPTYQQAWASVTLNPNASIADVDMTPSTVKSLDTADFYVDGIHDLIASRYLTSESDVRFGNTTQLNVSASSGDPVIVATDSTILNYEEYVQEIRQYWNSDFIVTIDRFFSPGGFPTPVEASQQSFVIILTVASKAATLAEAILALGLCMIATLIYMYRRRSNFLQWDPGSIAAQCTIVAQLFKPSTKVMFSEAKLDMATTRQLRQWANGKWCEWVDEDGEEKLQVVDRSEASLAPPHPPPRRRDPMPHFLRPIWFLLECLLFAAILALFGVSLSYIRLKNINSLFSTGATVAMIFLNFGPTAIASIIGSFLVSIYRNLSSMEPWIRLQDGMASARQSVVENYGIQTPFIPLFIRRHRRSGILLTLSIVCLGDLVLRILSGGLFTPQLKNYLSPSSDLISMYNSSAMVNNVNQSDIQMTLVATGRLLNNVSFLQWASTDGKFFMVPFSIHNTSEDDQDEDDDYTVYSATTRGFGADLDCKVLPAASSDTSLAWNYKIAQAGVTKTCTVDIPLTEDLASRSGKSIHYYAPNGTDNSCQESSIFVLAFWDLRNITDINEAGTTALHCEPKIHIQDFHVEVDSSGMVQDQRPISGSSISSGSLFHNASAILADFNQVLAGQPRNFSSHHFNFSRPHGHRRHHQHDWPGRLTANAYDMTFPDDFMLKSEHLMLSVQTVYQTVFSTHLALWKDKFLERLPTHSAQTAHGNLLDSLWGFIPSTSLVVIIICLLAIDAVALMAVFAFRFNRYRGPRVPRSIGSLIPWVVQSRMLADLGDTWEMSEREREGYLLEKDCKYKVGDFSAVGGPRWALDYDYDDQRSDPGIELQDRGPVE
ncbi:hypothetical protein PMG11_08204 [Penicillium brasilianum]|uniref:Uncharacterized protein n=1 Tax=Penicillium brasilianum TaxID=104259 RepID=A0A0F7TW15_PENBI|nr:hypothetical protein PMG11_08204 [Penicillium brasilianum]